MTHEHGLQSDCPRCEQYVERLYDLDDKNLSRIWRNPKTTLDSVVQSKLYEHLVTAQKLISAFQFEAFDPGHDIATAIREYEKPAPLTVDQLFDIYHGKVTA